MNNTIPRNTILIGDVRDRLAKLPEDSVDCVITSPPYFQLRNYGAVGQIGLEPNVNDWVNELRVVMRGIARVLKPTGSLWLNVGDSYARHPNHGAPEKSLLLGPERLLLALVDEDGWSNRNRITWAKTNTMPSSVKDRLSCTSEALFLLVREQSYFFDLDNIREPHRSKQRPAQLVATVPTATRKPVWTGPLAGDNRGLKRMRAAGVVGHPLGKNPGDVWHLPVSNFRGAHPATFPPALVVKPLLASCPERVCKRCGMPWKRAPMQTREHQGKPHTVRGTLQAVCRCKAGWQPGVVLDPFFGAGTVGVVAQAHGRDWVGVEINAEYSRLAEKRITDARKAHGDKT